MNELRRSASGRKSETSVIQSSTAVGTTYIQYTIRLAVAHGSTGTWVGELAEFLLDSYSNVPNEVLERAALHLLDTIGCAAGADKSLPVAIARRAVKGSGPTDATLFFAGQSASLVDAVLVNGTAARFLDANDVALSARKGPGGHPSDNIVVALALAEKAGSSGRETLSAIVLGYELAERLMRLGRSNDREHEWDHVSWSGMIAAAMTAALMGADRLQLANALAIAGAKGYAVKAIRYGEISMLKAAGNALVAREGVFAALLALEGLTGPPEVFESATGIVKTMGGHPHKDQLRELTAPPSWAINRVSIKAFPAIGTSQAALHAAAEIAKEGNLEPRNVTNVRIRLPATKWTERTMAIPERLSPKTRESADHSIPFLAAVVLTSGDLKQEDFENERWKDPAIKDLMAKTTLASDQSLSDLTDTAFPAAIEVQLRNGRQLSSEVIHTPGSPAKPWGRVEIIDKFRRLDRVGLDQSQIMAIGDECLALVDATSVGPLIKSIA